VPVPGRLRAGRRSRRAAGEGVRRGPGRLRCSRRHEGSLQVGRPEGSRRDHGRDELVSRRRPPRKETAGPACLPTADRRRVQAVSGLGDFTSIRVRFAGDTGSWTVQRGSLATQNTVCPNGGRMMRPLNCSEKWPRPEPTSRSDGRHAGRPGRTGRHDISCPQRRQGDSRANLRSRQAAPPTPPGCSRRPQDGAVHSAFP
jgi:hypothetical protein